MNNHIQTLRSGQLCAPDVCAIRELGCTCTDIADEMERLQSCLRQIDYENHHSTSTMMARKALEGFNPEQLSKRNSQ